ncbi:MAG TPA: cation diffusion facilitator family transporter [Acidimicrobiia bacterium]|nr:cation diffusion facilitator family transporter [Acidimicrobiia bacterium]
MQEGSRRAIVAAFLANLGIAIAKFVGFAITGAASLLAEALHSVADTGNQALLFLGGARARRRPTPEHPFGYGRERYFWAFVVALMLFSLGGLFAVYEGIDKLLHPHQLESVAIALAVLSVAIVLESLSFRTAFVEAAAVKGEESWWSFIRRSKSPELPVVLLEDTGALLGLGLAFVGVSLAEVTGNPRWDAVGSIGIGILLVVIAIVLAAEMKSLLIGESATAQTESAIRAAIRDGPEVRRIIHLRTLHLGPDELLVAAKVELDSPSVPDLTRAIDTVEVRIRAAVPIARLIYLEPDVYRSDAVVDR